MTRTVRNQIVMVRDTGRTNMFDWNMVQRIANDMGLYELVVWMADRKNKSEYTHLIFTGEAELEE